MCMYASVIVLFFAIGLYIAVYRLFLNKGYINVDLIKCYLQNMQQSNTDPKVDFGADVQKFLDIEVKQFAVWKKIYAKNKTTHPSIHQSIHQPL